MLLAAAPLNKVLNVTQVLVDGPLSCRLMEMGLIEGATVQVLRRAPLGDPMQVRLGDYELSLRNSEAKLINVAAA